MDLRAQGEGREGERETCTGPPGGTHKSGSSSATRLISFINQMKMEIKRKGRENKSQTRGNN